MYNINKEILQWSTEGVALNCGCDLKHVTFKISRDDFNGDLCVHVWCVFQQKRYCEFASELIPFLKKLWNERPESWRRDGCVYIEFEDSEMYHEMCDALKTFTVTLTVPNTHIQPDDLQYAVERGLEKMGICADGIKIEEVE